MLTVLALLGCAASLPAAAQTHESRKSRPPVLPAAGTVLRREPARAAAKARVNFAELARRAALAPAPTGPPVPVLIPEGEEPPEPIAPASGEMPQLAPSTTLLTASPAPSTAFPGIGDINSDNPSAVIPPDVDGAVGRTAMLEGLNNDYRVFQKGSGGPMLSMPISTFWAASGGGGFFDPRTLYDPINDRWIVCVLSDGDGANSSIEIGVSESGDPAGSYFLFRVRADTTGATWADFPSVGFNGKWVAINVNLYGVGSGGYSTSKCLAIDYPQLRGGTLQASFLTGSSFCSSPAATYTAAESTLYVATHLSSAQASYRLDTITGPASHPVYTVGSSHGRGIAWIAAGGNLLPQAAPRSGTSACGSTPCKFEAQDAYLRTTPVVRDGALYYVQTVGLPSNGLTHTAVQWTKLALPGGTVADGGRIEDATANATNGGQWYAYPHIAVNRAGDIMVGFGQFSSAHYASSGYAVHLAGDPAGSMRTSQIFQAGSDYYHKDFGTGRNRWGDYSKVQVDPSDDQSLWVLQEYAQARIGSNDGTGANSSHWGTWWAVVSGPPPTVSLAPGPAAAEGDSGTTAFPFTIQLSTGYSLPITVDYQTVDSTAFADTDYQPVSSFVEIPAGTTTATVSVNVIGNRVHEPDKYFQLQLLDASSAVLGNAFATATIQNDDPPPAAVGGEPGAELALGPIVPNPTRDGATIEYRLPHEAEVQVTVNDLAGRRVAVLAHGRRAAGRHAAIWNGRGAAGAAPDGVYFVRLDAGGRTQVRRLLLVR